MMRNLVLLQRVAGRKRADVIGMKKPSFNMLVQDRTIFFVIKIPNILILTSREIIFVTFSREFFVFLSKMWEQKIFFSAHITVWSGGGGGEKAQLGWLPNQREPWLVNSAPDWRGSQGGGRVMDKDPLQLFYSKGNRSWGTELLFMYCILIII